MTDRYHIRIVSSLHDVDPKSWNSLLTPGNINPFVTHEFLNALETSSSACAETGWLPQHLLLEAAEGDLLGALPCYLKDHSQGEYVFDHGWADAFMRAGGDYYPKLQSSIPFTPASGPRFLVPKSENAEVRMIALAQGVKQLCDKLNVSSAHITFMDKPQWDIAASQGYLLRTDQQFHWNNNNYENFEQFLMALSSRKRKNIRKERETANSVSGLEVEFLTANDLNEQVWDQFFMFYQDTGARKWGHPYLTREFFSRIGESLGDRTLLIMAKRNGHYIAGALNFIGDECLYGRHWGSIEDHPCLHFELCYYRAIEYAIENNIKKVEAGAQGAHKLARGYMPVTTRSAHWITHSGFRQAVEDYLVQERMHVDMENRALKTHAPFKKTGMTND